MFELDFCIRERNIAIIKTIVQKTSSTQTMMTQDINTFGPQNTRETLLATGEKFFALLGYEVTTVRHLGESNQINPASVNYYFGSKENLLKAIFEKRLQSLQSKFVAVQHLRFETEQEAIETIMDILIHFSNEHTYFFDLLFRELSAFKISKCRRLLFSFFKETMQIIDSMLKKSALHTISGDRFLLMYQLLCLSHPILNISSKFEEVFSPGTVPKNFQYHPIRLKNHIAKF